VCWNDCFRIKLFGYKRRESVKEMQYRGCGLGLDASSSEGLGLGLASA